MYKLADETYTQQPARPSEETICGLANWIERYCRERALRTFHVFLHGGEPLLAGKRLIRQVVESCRTRSKDTAKISFSLLTNGLLLDDEWVQLFTQLDISFSISLDGPEEYHDRFRLGHQGEPTHAKVEAWVRRLISDGAPTFTKSTLCVLSPKMDGRRLVDYFYDLRLRRVDLLLPDQNHVHGSHSYPKPSGAAYGRVLEAAYRRWMEIDDPDFSIRKFELLVSSFLGVPIALDSLGCGPVTVFSVETNGGVEPVDTMKICGNGFTKSSLRISEASPEDVENLPLIALGLSKGETVVAECLNCPYVHQCGGGYLPHRWTGEGYAKTVYCEDMLHICSTIGRDVADFTNARQQAAR